MADQFLTIAESCEGYYMDRGSKFLAYGYPVVEEEEAMNRLQILRKAHPKARHFCTALRLFPDASLERSNDDGEPSGSAGKPILGQLIKNDLTNIFIVVVRYFGGTKLGVPGLIEAYRTATVNALENAIVIQRHVMRKALLTVPYELHPHLINDCKQNGIAVLDEKYQSSAAVQLGFPKSNAESILLAMFKRLTQHDYPALDEYVKELNIDFEWLPGDQYA